MEHLFEMPNKPLSSDLFFKENNANLFIRDNKVVIVGDLTKEEAQNKLNSHFFEPIIIDKKTALLEKLGITAEEAQLLLGGK